MDSQLLLFLLVLLAVLAVVSLAAVAIFAPDSMRQRLARFLGPQQAPAERQSGWIERAARVAEPFTRLSLPDEGWENSSLRTRFMNAGWRRRAVPTLYFASKSILALVLPALAALPAAAAVGGQMVLFILLLCAAFGYYLPNLVLARIAFKRQREIFETIPDALDLLTVCVEAGLSLERSLAKVAGEIHLKSVALAQELQLVLMEMRAGFSKEKALRNFALRSGVDDVDTLVAMLVQSERFGTSMGTSLRVHSDNLRSKRRLLAEEAAAKVSLKLMFPLIFCIFPALMVVLLGPAAIQLMQQLLPVLTAGH